MVSSKYLRWSFGLLLVTSQAFAQESPRDPPNQWALTSVTARESGQFYAPELGDKIDMQTGSLSFSQTDIAIGGVGPKMIVTRSFDVNSRRPYAWNHNLAFADWDMEIPQLHTNVNGNGYGPWHVTGNSPIARCTNFGPAASISADGYTYSSDWWWKGAHLSVPGYGSQELMLRDPSNKNVPSVTIDGVQRIFDIVTKDNWVITCLPATKNGEPGEAFLAVSPEGIKYWFDWMTFRFESRPDSSYQTYFARYYRTRASLLVTRVEDRYGNSLTYSYSENRLQRINASDGRELKFVWSGNKNTSGSPVHHINEIILQPQSSDPISWKFTYEGDSSSGISRHNLSQVLLPDLSRWQFSLGNFSNTCYETTDACQYDYPDGRTGSITTPSGLTATFNIKGRAVERNGAYTIATPTSATNWTRELDPSIYVVPSLKEKTISGLGVSRVWKYGYFNRSSDGAPLAQAKTYIVNPDETVDVYSTDNAWRSPTEGSILRIENFRGPLTDINFTGVEPSSIGSSLRVQQFEYTSTPTRIGLIPWEHADKLAGESVWPLKKKTIVQDGVTFVWEVGSGCAGTSAPCFDSFARPTKVIKANSLGHSRTDVTAYHDNLSRWALGQVKSVTNVETGLIVSQTDYDATYALPIKNYRFHLLKQTLAYNTTATVASGQRGTLASVTDGRGNTTSVSNWKRGIPQKITHADGKFQSAVVNDNGTIASVTDENGYKTCYAYDVIGRLNKITYPSETQVGVCDTSAWNPTTITFAAGNPAAYGVPAGHWRQTTLTGRGRKVTIFDALWRPILEQTLDLDNVAPTLSVAVKRYDAAGRPVFESYPMATLGNYAATTLKGTHTTYDALDRPTYVKQDSELDLNLDGTPDALTTRTEYLYNADGYYTKATNPRGEITRTWYQAFDQPSYDAPVKITHPEGVTTHIYRDVFGKTTAIKRSGGGVTATRHYLYGGAQRLCMVTEPETGSMVVWYDGAENLTQSASGLNIPVGTSCPDAKAQAAASGRLVKRGYDARNRITSLRFPDGLGNTTHTYTADGLPATIAADNGGGDVVTTTYTYDKRRMMRSERLQWDTVNWPINYAYNANGHLASKNWHGLTVDYAPNSLGQPTRAGSYATGVSYHPNGAIKQFTYGNGIVHTLNQNVRGLPDRSRDAYGSVAVHDDSLDYDANGNVAAISDGLAGARGNRDMTYDGLDRLKTTISPMYGAMNAHYSYDALDNLTRVKIGGAGLRDHWYCYDAKWRLTNIKTVSCSGTTVVGLGYDVQGNVNNKNGVTYNFDHGNRLRSVTGSPASSYLYDGHGRRILDTTSAKKHSQYAASGELTLTADERRQVVAEYVHLGGSLLAIRERYTPTNTYSVKYQHTDALGSPVAVTNESRAVVERNEYEPYGKVLNHPLKDGPGYTGHVADAATGLIYAQQRYYDDDIGRFLSVDPVTPYSDPVGQFNRYRYAANNPYKFTDPDGRQALDQSHKYRATLEWAGGDVDVANAQISKGFTIGIAASAAIITLPVATYEAGMLVLANPGSVATATSIAAEAAGVTGVSAGTVVTAAKIEAALSDSTMRTAQRAISLPAVQRYVDKLLGRSPAPAIKVADGVIVDGNHRYVAGRIVGREPAVEAGTLSPSQASQIQPIQKIKVDPTDWGNE